MACLAASNFGHAAILALAATMGMTIDAPVSAQAPRATSVTSQNGVGTVTNNLGTGTVFSGAVANRVASLPHFVVEMLCLEPTAEAVQPLFIGTDLVCVPK
jgi:hypothetical protein